MLITDFEYSNYIFKCNQSKSLIGFLCEKKIKINVERTHYFTIIFITKIDILRLKLKIMKAFYRKKE